MTTPLTEAPKGTLRTAVAMVVLALVGLMAGPVANSHAATPKFSDGHGISVVGETKQITDRTSEIEVATDAVDSRVGNAGLKLRVTLPENYDPNTRYPSLYLLHGQGANYKQWTEMDLENITAGSDMIIITPEGGTAGWYTDWVNQDRYAMSIETFHIKQLIPFIDQNLPTKADKAHRGIAGLSMGGFGAMHYATRHPDLFNYAGSFSGGVDLENQAVRGAILFTVAQRHQAHPEAAFGPVVWPKDGNWKAHNPVRNAAALKGLTVSLYAGGDVTDPLESNAGWSTHTLSGALDRAGVEHVWDMYGQPGTLEGYPCTGRHTGGCWEGSLKRDLPRITAAIGA